MSKLTDREWNPIARRIRDWERDHRTPFSAIRDAFDAVLAKRDVEKEDAK